MKLSAPPYLLRPMEDSDIEWVFRALSDPIVYRYYGIRCLTMKDARDQMKWYRHLTATNTGRWFAIVDEDNMPVGGIGLNDYQQDHRCAEAGYWLLPEFWGKGIIHTVFPAVLEFGFGEWNLHRIEAIVEKGNTRSCKLLKKFHFTFEGTRRECEIKDGRFISLEMYSLLAWGYRKE